MELQNTNAPELAESPIAPAVIRGEVIDTNLVEFGGRYDDLTFRAPDPHSIVDRLAMGGAGRLADLHAVPLDEILEYLIELGQALDLKKNAYMQEALELSYLTAPTTPPLVRDVYEKVGLVFNPVILEETIKCIGRPYLEGWVEEKMPDGRSRYTRAVGARALHVVAGNNPIVSAGTIIRSAVTRSDLIIKAPSNDPFTGIAIARTMADMAPDHPVTKHVSVAYWKGGDQAFEEKLYQPHNIEKIVAWGGFASVKHITKYIQPGIELISLDPKRSISIIGPEAFASEQAMDEAAGRLAGDIGFVNQEACGCARVVYAISGSEDEDLERLEAFGHQVYNKVLALPENYSTPPKGGINRELQSEIDALRFSEDWYTVIGGEDNEGAVIVSRVSEPVEFSPMLTNRVVNIVPVDSIDDILPRVDAYCQTIGIYPESLIEEIRDPLALAGGQRIMSLGYAGSVGPSLGDPQDGIEPMRSSVKWIYHDSCDPNVVKPDWA